MQNEGCPAPVLNQFLTGHISAQCFLWCLLCGVARGAAAHELFCPDQLTCFLATGNGL